MNGAWIQPILLRQVNLKNRKDMNMEKDNTNICIVFFLIIGDGFMVGKRRAKVIAGQLLILLFQVLPLIGAFVLEDLKDKKMGVARYLLFKKTEFEATLFSPMLMDIYLAIFIAGALICLILLVRRLTGKAGISQVLSLLLAVIGNGAGIYLLHYNPDLDAYYFFMIAVGIAILLQYISLIFLRDQ